MSKNILMLFAPKFKEFGCDVAREYIQRSGGGIVHGLCTGPISVTDTVSGLLWDVGGQFLHVESEEFKWVSQEASSEDLIKIEEELGIGAVGLIITSDRRVGGGLVRGGLCRPDFLADKISKFPDINPQRYIVGLYKFLDKLLKETMPDMVFIYAVAGAPALMLAKMALARNIPMTRPTPARIGNRTVVDSEPLGLLSCVKRLYEDQERNSILDGKADEAKKLLDAFRSLPEPPDYMIRNNAVLASNTPVKVTANAILITLKIFINIFRGRRDVRRNFYRVIWKALISWRREIALRSFKNSKLVDSSEFIYYPLHVDPEASTQVLSPYHTDQLSVIEALAKSAPADKIIVVKEHAPMVGLRPKGFYDQIRKMPRVVLLGPEYSGLDLVKKASVTTVLTGTAAWEAIRLGKPTVIIGNSPFLAIGSGAIYEPNLANLSDAIYRALELKPASDQELIRYISALLLESFEMDSSIMWGNYLEHDEAKRVRAVSNIVNGIIRRQDEQKSTPNFFG